MGQPKPGILRWVREWYQQMALIVAVCNAIRPRSNLHCKCQKFSYAIKNSWIQTSTRKKHWHRHDNSCKQVEKSILSVIPDLGRPVSGIPDLVLARFRNSWNGLAHFGNSWFGLARWVTCLKQTCFLEDFTQYCSHFVVSRHSLRTWHGYFEKKLDLTCFFWQYRQLKQSSAAPQGLPPPTQQIKIPIQISWVGRSTN